jgi:hypothetical protein
MLIEELDRDTRASVNATSLDPQGSAFVPSAANEPEMRSLSREFLSLAPQAANPSTPEAPTNGAKLKSLFFTQQWHRPYAEALLESDPAKLPGLVAVAEQAILNRYLELTASASTTDERVDLGHAVDALAQLRKTNRL